MLFWITTTESDDVIQNFDLHTFKTKAGINKFTIAVLLPIADSNLKTIADCRQQCKNTAKCHVYIVPSTYVRMCIVCYN